MKKDFEKNATELNLIKEQKEKLAHELQVGGVKWVWLKLWLMLEGRCDWLL